MGEKADAYGETGSVLDPENFITFSSTTSVNLGFGTWRQPSADRPTLVIVEVVPETDGTSDGIIDIEVDESGGTVADYAATGRTPAALSSGVFQEENITIILPEGAQYRIMNTSDPNLSNSISYVRESTL